MNSAAQYSIIPQHRIQVPVILASLLTAFLAAGAFAVGSAYIFLVPSAQWLEPVVVSGTEQVVPSAETIMLNQLNQE